MAINLNLDTTKLSQAGQKKLTPHDNCTVLDLGTGSFPRLIELRLPGVDGARQSALWDGSLDLEVNDLVIADEYAGQSIWRISSMGGGDSGAGKVRVSKVWSSDFANALIETTTTDINFDDNMLLVGSNGNLIIGDTTTGEGNRLFATNSAVNDSGSYENAVIRTHGIIDTDQTNINTWFRANLGFVALSEVRAGGVSTYVGGVLCDVFMGDGTVTNLAGAVYTPRYTGGTVTNMYGGLFLPRIGNADTAPNLYGLFVKNDFISGWQGTPTNAYGLYIDQMHGGTLSYGIYQANANDSNYFEGDTGVGISVPLAKLHVDQSGTTSAIPPLYLDQADISEEMVEFNTTIGTGNAIEVSALKLLTTTHFVKVTLPGGLTRYMPVGTISTTGPILYKSQTVTTQGLGANPDIFGFGFYEWVTTDANLTQASTTQTFGTLLASYAAHAFVVVGSAGSTDAGVVGLRVNGISINDQGTLNASDTETIIADITAVATDEYHESGKKWLGQVTFELFTVSGSPTTFSLDFNYGTAKYDDWGNNDFTITDIEAVGFAGANDNNFDIKLMHHRSTGWTYAAAGFTPITAANTIASLVGDHGTNDKLIASQHASWKRDNLTTAINGTGSEGFLIFVSSSANNSVEYLNLHIGVVF